METWKYPWVTACKNVDLQRDVGENVKVSLERLISWLSSFGYLEKGSGISAVYSGGGWTHFFLGK